MSAEPSKLDLSGLLSAPYLDTLALPRSQQHTCSPCSALLPCALLWPSGEVGRAYCWAFRMLAAVDSLLRVQYFLRWCSAKDSGTLSTWEHDPKYSSSQLWPFSRVFLACRACTIASRRPARRSESSWGALTLPTGAAFLLLPVCALVLPYAFTCSLRGITARRRGFAGAACPLRQLALQFKRRCPQLALTHALTLPAPAAAALRAVAFRTDNDSDATATPGFTADSAKQLLSSKTAEAGSALTDAATGLLATAQARRTIRCKGRQPLLREGCKARQPSKGLYFKLCVHALRRCHNPRLLTPPPSAAQVGGE